MLTRKVSEQVLYLQQLQNWTELSPLDSALTKSGGGWGDRAFVALPFRVAAVGFDLSFEAQGAARIGFGDGPEVCSEVWAPERQSANCA